MKRFWDKADTAEAEGRFAVLLDGRPVRLPSGSPLQVRSRVLAEALAEEWDAAGGGKGNEFSHEEVPLTRLVGTAEERIAPDPAPTVAALTRYAETDLLCYRAEDRKLAERRDLNRRMRRDGMREGGERLRRLRHRPDRCGGGACPRHARRAFPGGVLGNRCRGPRAA